ncbi:MAG: thiamine pyrophosphate-dependent enzyme [Candidatus Shapirobacteria bacterium]
MIDLKSKNIPTWCPGCHDFIIFACLQQAINKKEININKLVIVYDIGCSGNMADFLKVFGVHSLHGRSIPTAIGIKLARPELTVIAIGGEGAIYGEGMGHLIAAARLNIDLTVLIANNQLYSLTTGQTSPTTPKGAKTKSTPEGAPSVPVAPVALVNAVNPDAKAVHVTCLKPPEVTEAIVVALENKGFNLVDIDQLCVTFSKQLTS